MGFLRGRKGVVAAIAIVIVSLSLRPAIVAMGPLLDQIRAGFGLSPTAAGILTTLPVVCFGIFSPAAGRIAARFGMEATLLGVLVAIAAGITIRILPSVVALFAGTAIAGTAIAIGNVVVPALIKRDFAHRLGLMTGLYSMAVSAGSALTAALTVPIQEAFNLGWRPTLASWATLALIGIVAWLPHVRSAAPVVLRTGPRPNPWRSATAWWVTVFFGLQSLGFYATQAWLPEMLQDRGYSNVTAGLLLGLANIVGVVTSFLAPILAARKQVGAGIIVGLVTVAGWLVFVSTSMDALAVTLLGMAQGAGIAVALLLIGVRSPDAAHAAELSAMSQGAGYLIAATGPFAVGALLDATGHFTSGIWLLTAVAVVLTVTGGLAGRPGTYDVARRPAR